MRAAVYRRHGPSADVLNVEEIDTPEPGPGQVRVRIVVSGVNPTDWKLRNAGPEIIGFQVPNHDGAGVIDAVGPGVDPARIGERVWVYLAATNSPYGTAAEYTVVPADRAVTLPNGVSFELAASMGVPAITAHRCLFADGPIAGKVVLVAGGAGAVGHYAIQLARAAEATVITTVSGHEKSVIARQAGAHYVVNYREGDPIAEIRAVSPDGVDRIIEVALGANMKLNLAVAAPGATIVTYASAATNPELPVRDLMIGNLVLRFVLLYNVPGDAVGQAVLDITAALAEGALTELPLHRYSLDDIAAAHDAVQGGAVGKVLVDL